MVSAFIRNVGVAVLLLVAQSSGALADKRVALVIGNSAYQNVPGLPNPINDATAIAELLRNAGFDVVDSRAQGDARPQPYGQVHVVLIDGRRDKRGGFKQRRGRQRHAHIR